MAATGLALSTGIFWSVTGHAATTETAADEAAFSAILRDARVSGRVGIYDFRRWHNANLPYPRADGAHLTDDDEHNLETTAYGAQIDIDTGQWHGLSFGAQFVYTSSFYGDNDDQTRLNCNLVCGESITNLPEAYVQYNTEGAQIRAGRQLLNLPFASDDQFSFLPRAYQGVTVLVEPLALTQRWRDDQTRQSAPASPTDADGAKSTIKQIAAPSQFQPFELGTNPDRATNWQLFAAKITRFERRGSARHFIRANRYLDDVDGFWTAGTNFRLEARHHEWVGQYYHFGFDETENLDYGELGYIQSGFKLGSQRINPYVRAQAVKAYDIADSRIEEGIDGEIYGLKLGLKTGLFDVALVGNFAPTHKGSFNDGQILHPYNDQSGVLYTDGFTGIAESGPGWAGGVSVSVDPTPNLNIYGKYVEYEARRGHYYDYYFDAGQGTISNDSFVGQAVDDQRSTGWYAGFSWDLGDISPALAGLTIENVLGVVSFDNAPTFYDNRFRFFYRF
ncbi:hypothetical protein D3260_09045 [Salinisphaera sp. Q1T1-3]|nr:hypothetical protein D3260_09045 [Salinisphaera sp. Q1T1-3]